MGAQGGSRKHLRLQKPFSPWSDPDASNRGNGLQPAREDVDRLFELSLALLCVAGIDGYFKHLNPAFERILGHSRHELMARSYFDFVHPEDRLRTAREVEKLARGIPTVRFENRYRCKSGEYRWLAWTATPDNSRGLIYATALDITERHAEEERFRLIVEAAPDALIIADRNGHIALVNGLAEALFGYPRAELLGQPVEVLVPVHLQEQHRVHRDRYQAAPRPRAMGEGAEFAARRKDGSQFPAEISLSVIRTGTEELVVATIRDLSERKRTLAALQENELQLLAAQRIQARLLPAAAPLLAGFDIAAELCAAEFTAGDHYDFLELPDGKLGLVIGDVCGHGFPSALLMATSQSILRLLAKTCGDIGQILQQANRYLCDELEDNRFVTAFLGCLDVANRSLTYGSAGHPAGYLFDASGAVKAFLESTAMPLGLFSSTEFPIAPPMQLHRGDTLLLLTDGILEALRSDGELFGVERACAIVRANRQRSAREIVVNLQQAVREFTGQERLSDDVTTLVLKVLA